MEEDKWCDCNVEVLRTSSHIILILKKLLNLEVVKVEWKQGIENMWLQLLKIFKRKEKIQQQFCYHPWKQSEDID